MYDDIILKYNFTIGFKESCESEFKILGILRRPQNFTAARVRPSLLSG